MSSRITRICQNVAKWMIFLLILALGIGAAVAAIYLPYPSNGIIGMTLAFVMFLGLGVAYFVSYVQKRT